MFNELSDLEMQEVIGGKNAVEVLVGCLEVAGGVVSIGSSGFTGIAGAAGGAYLVGDGIQRIFG